MMGWKTRLIGAAGILGTVAATAQQGNINTSVFRASGSRGRVEVCWQIEPTVLHYQRVEAADSAIAATYDTELRIYRDSTLVKTDRWATRTPPVAPRMAAALNLLDGYSQTVPPGRYQVRLRFVEPVSPQTAFELQTSFEVDTPLFKTMATPQLLDTFYTTRQPQQIFIRNGVLALPLAADFLGDERRNLHFYTEAYEQPGMQKAKKPFRFESRILKGSVPFGNFLRTDTAVFRNGMAQVYATLPLAKLPSGNFFLQTQLTDAGGNVWATARRAFQRSNAQPEADTLTVAASDSISKGQKLDTYMDLEKTFVQAYKPVQLKAILRMIQPIAKPDEGVSIRTLLQGADVSYIRPFVYTFFAARNPKDPEGAWKTYSDQVRTVNRLFNLGSRVGYETERGRVYLQYGPPTERVTIPQESGSRPYEVWRYEVLPNGEKGGFFLFFQPGSRLDDFLLLHSTMAGEAPNRAWRQGLYYEGVNANARAESYFPER